MARFMPYGFTESKYPLWCVRDTRWAYKDQLKMAVILCFMLLGVSDIFFYFFFQFTIMFWICSIAVCAIFFAFMVPLWRYTKKWINDLEGTFYLRATPGDSGYQAVKDKVTAILQAADFKHRIEDRGFQSKLGTVWKPEKDIIMFTGPLNIVELSFDIAAEEGFEIYLNSLSKFPGMEARLISGLSDLFSIDPDGNITVRG